MAGSSKQENKDKKEMGDLEHLRVLVSNLLDGTNFLSWSMSIRIALGAKMKLGFINGKSPRPSETSKKYEQWNMADCLVLSWLLNSMLKDIVESFLYINTERELLLELEVRFRVSNGPMVYQLQREIASATQGTLSVSAYFSKLKKLWDELACLVSTSSCSCGASKGIAALYVEDNLMQFLMGLNDSFDHVCDQILMMEPLPRAT
ncbi:UNVERIFIED_CONTAM: hypothetical protein Slati_0134500 [Sesamum latifolium]|uniref:Retrotransposon Copia-like N-terminal domain-containing protein n=1 Tax=Sesamum latifolium TaxID=2727402 RepID=A0AAW2Y9Q6_9LAMI